MKKRILMVYPESPLTYWSFKYSLKFIRKKAAMPPLGLLTVASLLPEGYDIKLVDLNTGKLDDDDIRHADIVFVSAMIVQKKSFMEVVERCNRAGTPVAAGGPYPSSSHESISGVDYFVLDEGEVTVPRFIRDWEAGTACHIYRAEEKPDLSLSPAPRYDLINVNNYASMAIQYSRGCPFSCEFCDIIEMFGRKPRVKAVEQFIAEMEALRENGYRGSVFIVDDNFIGNTHEVKHLLGAIALWQEKHSFPFTFYTESSINLAAEEEILDLMVRCRFTMVFLGIETPDENTLTAINKGQNVRFNIFDSIKKIQSKGIEVTSGFIVGFDTDTDDIFSRQVDFIQRAGIPMSMIGILTALPGTRLYRRLESEGRLLEESSGNNTNKLDMNFIPVMDRERLVTGYKHVLREIYTPANYFRRTLTFLSRVPAGSKNAYRVEKGDIAAFARSFITQTFSRYGFRYLSFLFKAALFYRDNFALAVNIAVKGHHFFTITRLTLASDELNSYSLNVIAKLEATLKEKKLQGRLVPAFVNIYALHARRQVMRKYRGMAATVRSFSRAEYEGFIRRIDEIAESCLSRVPVPGLS